MDLTPLQQVDYLQGLAVQTAELLDSGQCLILVAKPDGEQNLAGVCVSSKESAERLAKALEAAASTCRDVFQQAFDEQEERARRN